MKTNVLAAVCFSGLCKSVSKPWVMFFCLCGPHVLLASSGKVQSRISHDLALYQAFESVSQSINSTEQGGFVTIGADAACDFDSTVVGIQAAIQSGASEVRIASNGSYQENIILDNQSIALRGGFADCADADINLQVFSHFALIDGSALMEPVIYISGADAVQQIRLENLSLEGGTSVFPKFGGGLSVDLAAVDLQMLRVVIRNNNGPSGAGVNINAGAGAITVTGREVVIQDNDSPSIGGGLSCEGPASIVLAGMSLINNNDGNLGGGVYLRNGCVVSMYSELFYDALTFVSGIFNNNSASNGGGAYLFNGSELFLFGQRMCDGSSCLGSNQVPIHLSGNQSGNSAGLAGNGGGFFMAQSANPNHFYANGLYMTSNSAREDGGGGFIDASSVVVIERRVGTCWTPDRCNLIIDNSSGTDTGLGGAFYVDGGQLTVSQVYFEENRADVGTAINATGETAQVTVEGSIFDDNGDDGNDGFSDFSVVRASLGAEITIRHSTLADNSLQGSVFDIGVASDSSLNLLNSIVHDPGSGDLFGPVSGTLLVNCILAHESSSFSGSGVLVADPQFFDRLGGNFHLNPISPAIDLCDDIAMLNALDIDTENRGWDDPQNAHGIGAFHDAGADESYVNDIIFIDGFENILAR
ncbi:hypothetical protein [Marinicella litoralis]|uniref:Uncharacterized protein n=1 Tax=Marinicella litoralis TaxID=644220 RepID=A0A4R6XDX5_9GAMM|nr:hypothetical protein [Marinicella litoralis]TDR17516.1 hypothetical protein C8D91_2575 [Marinicella litoralis]